MKIKTVLLVFSLVLVNGCASTSIEDLPPVAQVQPYSNQQLALKEQQELIKARALRKIKQHEKGMEILDSLVSRNHINSLIYYVSIVNYNTHTNYCRSYTTYKILGKLALSGQKSYQWALAMCGDMSMLNRLIDSGDVGAKVVKYFKEVSPYLSGNHTAYATTHKSFADTKIVEITDKEINDYLLLLDDIIELKRANPQSKNALAQLFDFSCSGNGFAENAKTCTNIEENAKRKLKESNLIKSLIVVPYNLYFNKIDTKFEELSQMVDKISILKPDIIKLSPVLKYDIDRLEKNFQAYKELTM
jgi:hypothetical protein